MNERNKATEVKDEEAENLLAEYNRQVNTEGRHGYSELYHSDYSDSCCCC